MSHDDLAHLDAAYVLGALDPEDRRTFEGHLRSCTACARAVRDLEQVPRLLGQVDESVFRSAPETLSPAATGVPETLLPRLLEEVRRQRRERRSWLLAGAAAGLVLVAGSVLAGIGQQEGPDPPRPAAVSEPMDQVGQDVVRASLAVESVPWGTRLELTCRYEAGSGYRDDEAPSYALVVRTRDGSWEQVATWRAVPGRSVTVTGATAVRSDDIASVEVRSESGRALLEADPLNG